MYVYIKAHKVKKKHTDLSKFIINLAFTLNLSRLRASLSSVKFTNIKIDKT